jgi:probable HAF family extracellular repeat protein
MKDYDVVRIKETVFLKPLFGDAFLYSGGQMIDLGTLGGSNSDASGVNNVGQIVGYSGIIGDSTYHAFLLQPVQNAGSQ